MCSKFYRTCPKCKEIIHLDAICDKCNIDPWNEKVGHIQHLLDQAIFERERAKTNLSLAEKTVDTMQQMLVGELEKLEES